VETSKTEHWQNGKIEKTAAKNSLLDFETLQICIFANIPCAQIQ